VSDAEQARERYRTSSPEETEALGRRLAEALEPPAILLLYGDLGAGKTLLTRGLVAGFGAEPEEVSSPTFALVNRYDGGRAPVYHLDLYRIDGPGARDALYELGLEEIFDARAFVVVEWSERLAGFPVPPATRIEIVETGEEARDLVVERARA
jgi:tRNA threonylcarbamoyladenosine biosynthesis protein TsaE